jgi:hypothetical protein
MGGTLRFASRPGRGSRFIFELQATEAPPSPATKAQPTTARPTKEPPPDVAPRPAPQTLQRPPAEALRTLTRHADEGGWSDIEAWLDAMADQHPRCGVFLDAVREALNELDFERIRALARR